MKHLQVHAHFICVQMLMSIPRPSESTLQNLTPLTNSFLLDPGSTRQESLSLCVQGALIFLHLAASASLRSLPGLEPLPVVTTFMLGGSFSAPIRTVLDLAGRAGLLQPLLQVQPLVWRLNTGDTVSIRECTCPSVHCPSCLRRRPCQA